MERFVLSWKVVPPRRVALRITVYLLFFMSTEKKPRCLWDFISNWYEKWEILVKPDKNYGRMTWMTCGHFLKTGFVFFFHSRKKKTRFWILNEWMTNDLCRRKKKNGTFALRYVRKTTFLPSFRNLFDVKSGRRWHAHLGFGDLLNESTLVSLETFRRYVYSHVLPKLY